MAGARATLGPGEAKGRLGGATQATEAHWGQLSASSDASPSLRVPWTLTELEL